MRGGGKKAGGASGGGGVRRGASRPTEPPQHRGLGGGVWTLSHQAGPVPWPPNAAHQAGHYWQAVHYFTAAFPADLDGSNAHVLFSGRVAPPRGARGSGKWGGVPPTPTIE